MSSTPFSQHVIFAYRLDGGNYGHSGNPGWPKYDLDRRATIRFDMKSEVVNDPRSAERVLWEGLR